MCQRSPAGPEAAMGLLTGDALGPLAIAVAIFLLLVDLWHRRTFWAARFPPGPVPLPLLGNLLQMDFQNTLCYFDQVRKAGGGEQQRGAGTPPSSTQRGRGGEPQEMGRAQEPGARGLLPMAFVQGPKYGWDFPIKEGKGLERGVGLAVDWRSRRTALTLCGLGPF